MPVSESLFSECICMKFGLVDLYTTLREFHHHHHHMSVMELGHLLTRSGLTYLEVSSEFCHDTLCRLRNCVSL